MIFYPAESSKKSNLLFIHGMCHGAWCWDQGFMELFAASGYDCYAINLKGHEQSGKNRGINKVSIEDYVTDVILTIKKIGHPPILIGHSMGGFVIQKYLEKHQECKAAILLGSVPYYGLLGASVRYIGRHPLAGLNLLSRDIYGPFVKHAKELYYQDTESDTIVHYKELMRAESYKALIQMMFQPIKKPKPESMPMLCIGAANDKVIRPTDIEKTAEFHKTSHVIMDHFGHNMMLDEGFPQVFQVINKWLESIGLKH